MPRSHVSTRAPLTPISMKIAQNAPERDARRAPPLGMGLEWKTWNTVRPPCSLTVATATLLLTAATDDATTYIQWDLAKRYTHLCSWKLSTTKRTNFENVSGIRFLSGTYQRQEHQTITTCRTFRFPLPHTHTPHPPKQNKMICVTGNTSPPLP